MIKCLNLDEQNKQLSSETKILCTRCIAKYSSFTSFSDIQSLDEVLNNEILHSTPYISVILIQDQMIGTWKCSRFSTSRNMDNLIYLLWFTSFWRRNPVHRTHRCQKLCLPMCFLIIISSLAINKMFFIF